MDFAIFPAAGVAIPVRVLAGAYYVRTCFASPQKIVQKIVGWLSHAHSEWAGDSRRRPRSIPGAERVIQCLPTAVDWIVRKLTVVGIERNWSLRSRAEVELTNTHDGSTGCFS